MHWTDFKILVLCLAFIGCTKVERPNADECVINAPGSKITCYNMKNDYDEHGNLKPGVEPHFKSMLTTYDVNKYITMSPEDFAELKAYVAKLRDEYERGCQ